MTRNYRLHRAIRQYEFITVMYVSLVPFCARSKENVFYPRKVQRALNHSKRFTYVPTYAYNRAVPLLKSVCWCVTYD